MTEFAKPLVLTADHMNGTRESEPGFDRIFCGDSMRPDRNLQARLDRILGGKESVEVSMEDTDAELTAPSAVRVEKCPAGIAVRYMARVDKDSSFLVGPNGVVAHYLSPTHRSFEYVLSQAEKKLGLDNN